MRGIVELERGWRAEWAHLLPNEQITCKCRLWPCNMSNQGRTLVFEDESKTVTAIVGFQGERIVVTSAFEDFAERLQVDAQSERSVASVVFKTIVCD